MAIATFGAEHGWPGRCWTRSASSSLAQDSTRLSGLFHKYAHVRCAQFDPWRGAREGVYPQRYSTDRATKPRVKLGATRRAACFWPEALLLAPYRSTVGYARRSRLASAQNPLPRTCAY